MMQFKKTLQQSGYNIPVPVWSVLSTVFDLHPTTLFMAFGVLWVAYFFISCHKQAKKPNL